MQLRTHTLALLSLALLAGITTSARAELMYTVTFSEVPGTPNGNIQNSGYVQRDLGIGVFDYSVVNGGTGTFTGALDLLTIGAQLRGNFQGQNSGLVGEFLIEVTITDTTDPMITGTIDLIGDGFGNFENDTNTQFLNLGPPNTGRIDNGLAFYDRATNTIQDGLLAKSLTVGSQTFSFTLPTNVYAGFSTNPNDPYEPIERTIVFSAAIPEPASLTLLGCGAVCLLGARLRRRAGNPPAA